MDEQGRSTLFDGTQAKAGLVAARFSSGRKARILRSLRDQGPATIWEMAERLGLSEHQFAGRFSEMVRDRQIEKTGARKPNPQTNCEAEVYRLAEAWKPEDARTEEKGLRTEGADGCSPLTQSSVLFPQSYPDTLLIDGEPFTLAPIAQDEPPGVPYARGSAAGTGGGLVWRVGLVECEGCGKPLKMVVEAGKKTFSCGVPGCNRVWHLLIVKEPGGVELLAMVGKTA